MIAVLIERRSVHDSEPMMPKQTDKKPTGALALYLASKGKPSPQTQKRLDDYMSRGGLAPLK
jgi:hypothetical protein